MKRDPSLVRLSRDHHKALFVAMTLRRAEAETAEQARDGALAFWRQKGARHFRVEEEVLLPAYAAHTDPDTEAVRRMLVEHVRIREQMQRLDDDVLTLDGLQRLGVLLADHVRHEERTVFPAIESALDQQALGALAEQIARAEGR